MSRTADRVFMALATATVLLVALLAIDSVLDRQLLDQPLRAAHVESELNLQNEFFTQPPLER